MDWERLRELLIGKPIDLPSNEQLVADLAVGIHVTQGGKRIAPRDFYAPPPPDDTNG